MEVTIKSGLVSITTKNCPGARSLCAVSCRLSGFNVVAKAARQQTVELQYCTTLFLSQLSFDGSQWFQSEEAREGFTRQLNAGVQPPGLDVSRGEMVLCMFRSRRLRDRRTAR